MSRRASSAALALLVVLLAIGCRTGSGTSDLTTVDHGSRSLASIPAEWIQKAKDTLHIAYGHTSHGSQIITGMDGIAAWSQGGSLYSWTPGGSGGALDLRDNPFSGASDLGNPDRTSWASATSSYLSAHPEINVVMWSWCGQVSDATEQDIETYLGLMSGLEADYPSVTFVYMTGHLDGTGLSGNLHARNQQIRDFCEANGKFLYDFEDIESYDPDGTYFGGRSPHDTCVYDKNGSDDGNWALEWQAAHTAGVDYFDCSPAHTEAVNGNLKAFAAWSLWARLAGWEG